MLEVPAIPMGGQRANAHTAVPDNPAILREF